MRWLVLFLLALVGCEPPVDAEDVDTMGQPLDPWHMWGTSVLFSVPNVSASPLFQTTHQLARINYARPETWSFMLGAELLKAPTPTAGNLLVIVEYELITGVGRSHLKIPNTDNGQNSGFARFVWRIGVTGPIFPAQTKWTTQTQTPVLDEAAVTPFRGTIDHFPAQDIQCNAKVTVTTAAGVTGDPETTLMIHSYFAPRTHVRPEWFTSHRDEASRFRGNEQGGT